MARVVVAEAAVEDLRQLILSRGLPDDTASRVRRTLEPLSRFPELGAGLGGHFEGRRFILGPWRWLILVYRYDREADVVIVLAMVDGRTSSSPLANR